MEIDDILNGTEPTPEPAAETPQEPEVAPEPAKDEGPQRDEKGRFASKGEKADESPASDEYDGKATIGERRRRQEAEQRIAQLEAQLQQLANPPQPAPDMFENPEGWQNHFGQQVGQNAVNQATFQAKLQNSEMLAAQSFDDFEQVWDEMNAFLNQNPVIAQQAVASRHPWAHAYKAFKANKTAAEIGATDVDSLKAAIRAEIEAEAKAKPAVAIPQSLAGAGGVPGAAAPYKPPSLDEILR